MNVKQGWSGVNQWDKGGEKERMLRVKNMEVFYMYVQ
jgi:hypothetical protein